MQCREFREISDSYLNDELLVETNHQVFRHLENCPDCRADFAARRELRGKMRSAVRKADEFKMNAESADKLKADLKASAIYENTWRKALFSPKLLLPVMASLLIAVIFGYTVFYSVNKTNEQWSQSQNILTKELTEILLKAVGNHNDCALKKLKFWESLSKKDFAEKAVYTEKVLKPLRAKFSDKVEMLHAHDCIFEGKLFTHVILRNGAHVVSVFFDKSEVMTAETENVVDSIICKKENGLQVASFQDRAQPVFVVSDLPETENLNVARTLSDAWKQV